MRQQHCEHCDQQSDILIAIDGMKYCEPCYRGAMAHGALHIPEAHTPEALADMRFMMVIPPTEDDDSDITITEGPFMTLEDAIQFVNNEVGNDVPCYIEVSDRQTVGWPGRNAIENIILNAAMDFNEGE